MSHPESTSMNKSSQTSIKTANFKLASIEKTYDHSSVFREDSLSSGSFVTSHDMETLSFMGIFWDFRPSRVKSRFRTKHVPEHLYGGGNLVSGESTRIDAFERPFAHASCIRRGTPSGGCGFKHRLAEWSHGFKLVSERFHSWYGRFKPLIHEWWVPIEGRETSWEASDWG